MIFGITKFSDIAVLNGNVFRRFLLTFSCLQRILIKAFFCFIEGLSFG